MISNKSIRLDIFLSKSKNISRSKISELIKSGKVVVNQKIIKKTSYLINGDDKVEIFNENENKKGKEKKVLWNTKLDIIYEDNNILLINKPTGILCHPTSHKETQTIINALLSYAKTNNDSEWKPILIHRLDRFTSGILIVAKNDNASKILHEQLEQRKIKRRYICIVHNSFNESQGSITAPINYVGHSKMMMKIDPNKGKYAKTNFKVVSQTDKHALVICDLETGRTHQIRVHMQFIKHPVYNDPIYGINKSTDYNQYLHAYLIEYKDPETNEYKRFICDPDETFKNKIKELNLVWPIHNSAGEE